MLIDILAELAALGGLILAIFVIGGVLCGAF